MHRYVAPTFALLAATICLGLACAADPGDPLGKASNAASGSGSGGGGSDASGSGSGSSGGSSGGSNSSGSGSGSSSSGSSGSSGGSSSGSGSSSGGSSGSSGSGSGSSGSSSGANGDGGGVVDAGPIIPEGGASCVSSSCPLKVRSQTTSTNANTIGPDLNIVNAGLTAVDLANVKVHYYFTADGDTSLVFNCDYAGYFNSGMTGFDCSHVMSAFVRMGANATSTADTYLELSFSTASLPAGGTVSVNFRIHNSAFAVNYNQANDWSNFLVTTSYTDALYVTAYLNGTLAWGTEPGPLPPDAGRGDASSGGDADASSGDAGGGG